MVKKALSLILSAVLIITVCSVGAFASEEKLNYLLLGDSISRGAGIRNPDEACFGKIIANTNGYNYINDAVNGHRSDKMLEHIGKEKVINDIRRADIISISIGGNDFIKSNFIALFFGSLFNITAPFEKVQKKFYNNFSLIIEKIKAENPDAHIFVQTVYNMRVDLFRPANEIASRMLRESFEKYLEEHPGAYVIVDVASALDKRSDCLAIDTVHPNGKGNKIIAECYLKELKNQGLGTATEPVILVEPVEMYMLFYGLFN